jgi:hypothetical protein
MPIQKKSLINALSATKKAITAGTTSSVSTNGVRNAPSKRLRPVIHARLAMRKMFD